jgi:hydrogenase-1 operon protein HyaF
MNAPTTRPFPIPVVTIGPGSQPESDAPEFLPMPHDMSVYQAPPLPEPEAFAGRTGALASLHAALDALQRTLNAADRALLNQVLGEGEVAALVHGADGLHAQESVFAGVWRVLQMADGAVVRDTLEIGAFPQAVASASRGTLVPPVPATLPDGVMNAPAILEELRDRARTWQPGQPAHVMNLTLLPLTPADSELLQGRLGEGRVQVLSRGYGNCRIVDTRCTNVWRVTYFNSTDIIILDTLEVGGVPEVACAAPEDLACSAERLAEVLQWVETA